MWRQSAVLLVLFYRCVLSLDCKEQVPVPATKCNAHGSVLIVNGEACTITKTIEVPVNKSHYSHAIFCMDESFDDIKVEIWSDSVTTIPNHSPMKSITNATTMSPRIGPKRPGKRNLFYKYYKRTFVSPNSTLDTWKITWRTKVFRDGVQIHTSEHQCQLMGVVERSNALTLTGTPELLLIGLTVLFSS